jgi:hypothetical protein
MLRLTVSRPVFPGVMSPSGIQDQIFVTVRHLWVCWCRAPSLTRGWVCPLQLLLALSIVVILGSECYETHDHISLSQIRLSTNLAGSPYLYSPGTGWPSYTPKHEVPSSSPPTTRREAVEVFEPASTRTNYLRVRIELLYDWLFTANQFVLAPH